jgi:choline monooxygenase
VHDERLDVDPEIRRAWTLPAAIYGDPDWHRRAVERVLARSWQLVPVTEALDAPGQLIPLTLLPGSLDEPLLLTCDEQGSTHCLSNVCTHRGNLVVGCPGRARGLRCGYHGRRFALDGRFLSMPEFDGALNFPSPADDLPALPLADWGGLRFTTLASPCSFEEWIAPVRARIDGLAAGTLRFDPATARDYDVAANWLLYCDNYLEGFHIPYVHGGLAQVLDYGAYRTEVSAWGTLQVGVAEGAGPAFTPSAGHPDAGQRIGGYYFFLFPNLMLNFYPWGLSANLVEPKGPTATRVRFLSWVWDETQREAGAGSGLHGVELEDEAVVEGVQRGVRSRLYRRGRFSPSRETGVHHFHRFLAQALA